MSRYSTNSHVRARRERLHQAHSHLTETKFPENWPLDSIEANLICQSRFHEYGQVTHTPLRLLATTRSAAIALTQSLVAQDPLRYFPDVATFSFDIADDNSPIVQQVTDITQQILLARHKCPVTWHKLRMLSDSESASPHAPMSFQELIEMTATHATRLMLQWQHTKLQVTPTVERAASTFDYTVQKLRRCRLDLTPSNDSWTSLLGPENASFSLHHPHLTLEQIRRRMNQIFSAHPTLLMPLPPQPLLRQFVTHVPVDQVFAKADLHHSATHMFLRESHITVTTPASKTVTATYSRMPESKRPFVKIQKNLAGISTAAEGDGKDPFRSDKDRRELRNEAYANVAKEWYQLPKPMRDSQMSLSTIEENPDQPPAEFTDQYQELDDGSPPPSPTPSQRPAEAPQPPPQLRSTDAPPGIAHRAQPSLPPRLTEVAARDGADTGAMMTTFTVRAHEPQFQVRIQEDLLRPHPAADGTGPQTVAQLPVEEPPKQADTITTRKRKATRRGGSKARQQRAKRQKQTSGTEQVCIAAHHPMRS